MIFNINEDNLVFSGSYEEDGESDGTLLIFVDVGDSDAIDVKLTFPGNILVLICGPNNIDQVLHQDSTVPRFLDNNMYIVHLSKATDELGFHVAFASTNFEPNVIADYGWNIGNDTVINPLFGGWLNPDNNAVRYGSDSAFENLGLTKTQLATTSKFANASWLIAGSSLSGGSSSGGGGDEPSGDAYEYVDLGLSVKWATKNVGANAPSDSGGFFAWGDTEPRTSSFNWTGYKFIKEGTTGSNNINKYQWPDKKYQAIWYNSEQEFVGDGKRTLDATDDAAQVLWGGAWRMPSKAEVQELIDNCTWKWQQDYQGLGVSGWLITSNVEGYTSNSIFLPAAGHYASNTISGNGEGAFIWTAELYVSSYNSETTSAYSLNAEWWEEDDFEISISNSIRSLGLNIRPVREK